MITEYKGNRFEVFEVFHRRQPRTGLLVVTSMLVTDVGDEIVLTIGHQRLLYFYISVGQQNSKDVTSFEIQSPTFTNRHQCDLDKN